MNVNVKTEKQNITNLTTENLTAECVIRHFGQSVPTRVCFKESGQGRASDYAACCVSQRRFFYDFKVKFKATIIHFLLCWWPGNIRQSVNLVNVT